MLKLLILVSLVACSSRSFKKNYQVIDASSADIPEWVTDAQEWADSNEGKDAKSSAYYTFSSEPKNSRVTACEVAKLRVSSDIASEVGQDIKHELYSAVEGDVSTLDGQLDQYIDETLAKDVKSSVVGAKIHRTYWEKRQYGKDDDKKSGFTCSVLVKMSKKNLKTAYDLAFKKLRQKSQSSSMKAKIEQTKKAMAL